MKKRIRLKVAYDGTDFFGWQKQPNEDQTIQGILEKHLSQIYNEPISVVGSGRTDRGVHALAQWAHCDLPKRRDHSNLQYKLQRMTPETLSILRVEDAPGDFHAQISAVSKCYRYQIQVAPTPSPFQRLYSWQRKKPLSLNYLQQASKCLLGGHDFTSFQSKGTEVSSPVRELLVSRWREPKRGHFHYQIQGNGFLKQMVRNIVGTLIDLHDAGAPPEAISEILGAQDRQRASAPAPASGLFLASVQYPEILDNKCRKL
ncbi:MAG: tRNA pseudouridine(38-40) synthase TruA [Pseudomonadota bacterium]